MRSEKEIKAELAKIEADERYQSGLKNPANIEINAPLALIQLTMETKHDVLKWVLTDPFSEIRRG